MIPEGWKLVPIKPTEEMRVAGNNTGEFENDYPRDSRRAADHVWRVMLESAPSVPTSTGKQRMNSIGELKDIYVIAKHVGIGGDRIERFLRTAEMAGYVLVRKEPPSQSAAGDADK